MFAAFAATQGIQYPIQFLLAFRQRHRRVDGNALLFQLVWGLHATIESGTDQHIAHGHHQSQQRRQSSDQAFCGFTGCG